MKFQNPSFKIFLIGQTDGRTDGQAETNMLPHFFKVGGIMRDHDLLTWLTASILVFQMNDINVRAIGHDNFCIYLYCP